MTEKDGTTPDKAICLNSSDEDVMSNNNNNNNEDEEDGDELSGEDVASVYYSGSDLPSDHSSSDGARTPPSEFYDDISLSRSVSGHSSDTSEERWTGPNVMSAYRRHTSRQYLKRKEHARCVKSAAWKLMYNNWRLANRAKRQEEKEKRETDDDEDEAVMDDGLYYDV